MSAARRLVPALAALAAALALAVPSHAAPVPCGAATDGVYLATSFAVARRIAANERAGAAVSLARRTISADAVLAGALARGDLATIHSELLVLLFNHEHIVRIRVLRARQVVADIGGPNVLAPTSGTLRVAGKVVGSFEFSIQDDLGYELLAQRLAGAATVITYQGQIVLASLATGRTALPQRGSVTVAGVTYLVGSLETGRFPSGTLHIALLFRKPVAALASATCEQVRADVLGAIAERVYGEAIAGPGVDVARTAVAADGALATALAAGNLAAVRAAAPDLLRSARVSRLQVLTGSRVVADVGTRAPLVAPVPIGVSDASGRDVGTVLVSIQSVAGLYTVTSYLTQAYVLVRDSSHQLAGQRRGPATLPASGPIDYAGGHFSVFSFAGTLFPAGALTIHLLVRD
jgi:hypothetical protein